ncbi:hypothetical protein P7C73_g223, partial [Tremellales sp. Uapishka_1]
MSNSYQPIPSSSPPRSRTSSPQQGGTVNPNRPQHFSTQAEFDRPAPAWWKRGLLVLFVLFLGWLTVHLGSLGTKKPEIIYASRYVPVPSLPTPPSAIGNEPRSYSDEFKYRPAASPVITEYLKDGRVRLRGASMGGVGIKEEDRPKTPEQKRREEEDRRVEAREAAKERLGLKTKRGKKGKGKRGSKTV